jgi:hypothetical protein
MDVAPVFANQKQSLLQTFHTSRQTEIGSRSRISCTGTQSSQKGSLKRASLSKLLLTKNNMAVQKATTTK